MKPHFKTALGVALSLLLLWWVLRDVSPAEVLDELRRADPLLFLLAVLATVVGFAFRAVRWGVLLLPTGRVPFRPRFAATVIGFAANNLLPARVGEFARAFSLSRLTAVPVGASFATLVLERLLDGFTLVGLLFASMAVSSFPVAEAGGFDPSGAARVVALVMLGVGITLLVAVAAPGVVLRATEAVAGRVLPRRLRHPVVGAVRSFVDGLLVLRDPRLFLVSILLAVGQWLFTALSFLLAFRAFEIDHVGFAGAVFLQSLISLAVAIPSSPGFFGPFEAAARVGLGLWAVPADKAVSFAIGYHLGGFLPVTLMGIYYVWRLKLSWRDVRQGDQAVERAASGARPPHRAG